MSSSGKTYFVVAYDHDDEAFSVDAEMGHTKFNHDTWDSGNEEWVHLDWNMDMFQTVENLTAELKEKLQ